MTDPTELAKRLAELDLGYHEDRLWFGKNRAAIVAALTRLATAEHALEALKREVLFLHECEKTSFARAETVERERDEARARLAESDAIASGEILGPTFKTLEEFHVARDAALVRYHAARPRRGRDGVKPEELRNVCYWPENGCCRPSHADDLNDLCEDKGCWFRRQFDAAQREAYERGRAAGREEAAQEHEKEIEYLKHDIARYIEIGSDLAEESEQLRSQLLACQAALEERRADAANDALRLKACKAALEEREKALRAVLDEVRGPSTGPGRGQARRLGNVEKICMATLSSGREPSKP